jgi:hypothetical protein
MVALDEGTREYFFLSPAESYWGEFIVALVQNSIRWVCRDGLRRQKLQVGMIR